MIEVLSQGGLRGVFVELYCETLQNCTSQISMPREMCGIADYIRINTNSAFFEIQNSLYPFKAI